MLSLYLFLGPSLSPGISLKPSPVQIFMVHFSPVSFARYSLIFKDAFPCLIQKSLVSLFGEERVKGSHIGWEKNVGLKSAPSPRLFIKSTHFLKCLGSILRSEERRVGKECRSR